MSIVRKIAIVSPVLPARGGMGNVAANHARLLAARGLEVVLFAPDYDYLSPSTPHPTLSSGRRGDLKIPSPFKGEGQGEGWEEGGFQIKLMKPLLQYGNAAWVPGLGRRLRGFNIVILHYPFFGGAGAVYRARKKYGFKLVVYYHMDSVGEGFKKIIFDYNTHYFLPRLIHRADLVLTSSEDLARHSHLGRYWDNSSKFQVLPIGVDVNYFGIGDSSPRCAGFGMTKGGAGDNDDKIVLFVGMLDRAHYFKGVEYLIKAVSILMLLRAKPVSLRETGGAKQFYRRDKDNLSNDHLQSVDKIASPSARNDNSFKLVIVGSGDLLPHYQKLARALKAGDKIIFAGKVSGEQLVKYFQKATVTVLPSVSSESFGIVLVESMACGTPVIATDLPGVRSVFEDGVSGFVVPPRDSCALAEKIEYLLSNPEKAREMGDAGRKLVEQKYDWEKIGDKLLEFLISLAGRDLYDKS